MDLKLAFVGFGNVARAFAQMLTDQRSRLADRYDLRWTTTAIATANHGCVTSTDGINLLDAIKHVEEGGNLADLSGTQMINESLSLIETCDADVLFETTSLNVTDGEPATTYIKTALSRGIHIITANKGPIAFACSELRSIAFKSGACFRFEGTVMDGAPVFNLFDQCLPGTQILGFSGVLNSTTNLILTGMETGRSFQDSLDEARRRGIAEANADYDIDGWDAAVKAAALANGLMSANMSPADVDRTGIRDLAPVDLSLAAASGLTIRLVARCSITSDGIKLTVAPERVPRNSVFGSLAGTSNALSLETDLMGEIAIVEKEPGVQQTAYALLSDLISIHEQIM